MIIEYFRREQIETENTYSVVEKYGKMFSNRLEPIFICIEQVSLNCINVNIKSPLRSKVKCNARHIQETHSTNRIGI